MNKNKIIGVVIFLVTAAVPFNIGMLQMMKPDMMTLLMFVLSIAGIGLGAFFFSKEDKNADQAA